MTIQEQIDKFDNDPQNTNYFYDWFCNTSSIPAKNKKLMGIVKNLMTTKYFNHYLIKPNYEISFKNNCPVSGPLYDSIKIESAADDVTECDYCLDIYDERNEYKYTLWGEGHWQDKPLMGFNSLKELYDFLNNYKQKTQSH